LTAGQPDSLLGYPVLLSEQCPNIWTAGLYVGALVNLYYYWICVGLDIQIQRLQEIFATSNRTGFLARVECDGAPVLPEAFVRVKLGT